MSAFDVFGQVLAILGGVGGSVSGALDVSAWIARRKGDKHLEAHLQRSLPPEPTAAQIVAVVAPLMRVGGPAELAAGSNGGGRVYAEGVTIEGGHGPEGGGAATARAGDGGPHGPGGDLVMVGGAIRGGDVR